MLLNNGIKYYNDMDYSGKPIKVNDFLSDKYNNIHIELYQNALDNYIKAIGVESEKNRFLEENRIIEIKGKNYFDPSNIIIINLLLNKLTKVDLTPYWNTYQQEVMLQDVSYIYVDDDTKNDAELIYTDYVRGKSKMRSRFTGVEFWVDNNYINNDTRKGEEYTLNNTFTNLYYNK